MALLMRLKTQRFGYIGSYAQTQFYDQLFGQGYMEFVCLLEEHMRDYDDVSEEIDWIFYNSFDSWPIFTNEA